MYNSHTTPVLTNYFDKTLVRTRENPYCIDAQLLNTSATLLDDAALRYSREIKALQLLNCPTGLDNNGVYYSLDLDKNYSLNSDTKTLNSVVGIRNGTSYTLSYYDDTLPIPAGYELDDLRSAVQIQNPVITSFIGTNNVILVNTINQKLPIVNKLGFWLDSISIPNVYIDVCITGVKFPKSSWDIISPADNTDTETLQITSLGYKETVSSWISISSITIRNLPYQATLDCYSINFNVPGIIDMQRPVTLPAFRDVLFPRYWSINPDSNSLQESYLLDNLSGLVYKQAYNLSSSITTVCLEPNTWGGLLGNGTTLSYFDVREPLPDLSATGLTIEPCFGLDVYYDVSRSITNVILRPIPYANALNVNKYRYIIESPDNNLFVLLPDGSLIAYSGSAGWQVGQPNLALLSLATTGLYTITLECLDNSGVISVDIFPYENFDVSRLVKASFDISSLVINIESICYDSLGNLWVYDGLWAVPIKPYYNGYIVDPIGRKLYLTDKWDQVNYS